MKSRIMKNIAFFLFVIASAGVLCLLAKSTSQAESNVVAVQTQINNGEQMMAIQPVINVETITMTATPTMSPSPTPTPSATPTPTPTATPTPTPEPTPYYDVTDDEFEILCRITEAEAGEGNIEQKENVVSCIFARVESPDWPDTIEGVVFQRNPTQFSPVGSRYYYAVEISDSTVEAVEYIIMNGRQHDYIYFCSYDCESTWFAGKDARLAEQGLEPYRDGIHRY